VIEDTYNLLLTINVVMYFLYFSERKALLDAAAHHEHEPLTRCDIKQKQVDVKTG
jgi:hypothetical protein